MIASTTWLAFLLAALKALPAIISLISAVKRDAEAKRNQGIGFDLAVKAALEQTAERVGMAREIENEAERDHLSKSDDSAFDQDFIRKG